MTPQQAVNDALALDSATQYTRALTPDENLIAVCLLDLGFRGDFPVLNGAEARLGAIAIVAALLTRVTEVQEEEA